MSDDFSPLDDTLEEEEEGSQPIERAATPKKLDRGTGINPRLLLGIVIAAVAVVILVFAGAIRARMQQVAHPNVSETAEPAALAEGFKVPSPSPFPSTPTCEPGQTMVYRLGIPTCQGFPRTQAQQPLRCPPGTQLARVQTPTGIEQQCNAAPPPPPQAPQRGYAAAPPQPTATPIGSDQIAFQPPPSLSPDEQQAERDLAARNGGPAPGTAGYAAAQPYQAPQQNQQAGMQQQATQFTGTHAAFASSNEAEFGRLRPADQRRPA